MNFYKGPFPGFIEDRGWFIKEIFRELNFLVILKTDAEKEPLYDLNCSDSSLGSNHDRLVAFS
jgi:hypothetical protein